MRLFRLFIATLCLAVLGLSTAPAHALGTLNVSPPIWSGRVSDRPINILNRRDCIDGNPDKNNNNVPKGAIASFSYKVTNASGGVFQVWSGAACDVAANRSATAVTKTCVLVATGSVNETRVDIPVRDMVKAYSTASTGVADNVADCDAISGAGLQARNLFFVVFSASDQSSLVTATPTSWAFKYDITAPPAPSNVTAGAGDKTLVTSFSAPTGETNLLHYHMYCSLVGPAPATSTGGTGGAAGTAGTNAGGSAGSGGVAGTDAAAGAAPAPPPGGTDTGGTAGVDTGGTTDVGGTAGTDVGGTAGTDVGGTAGATTGGTTDTAGSAGTGGVAVVVDPNCTSSILIPGQPVPAGTEGLIDCGQLGAQGVTGGETNPVLENDNQYAVAISTEDDVNNIGVLSNLACGTPKDVTGFFEAYTKAGGEAGGGYCTFAPAHHDAVAMGLALMLGACAFWRRRK